MGEITKSWIDFITKNTCIEVTQSCVNSWSFGRLSDLLLQKPTVLSVIVYT